ncbi:hypothetical protein B0909_03475 [Rhizobium rhizogenes]|nr:hypothetical protein B0909_03475 [Rhizobium rhizogenes]
MSRNDGGRAVASISQHICPRHMHKKRPARRPVKKTALSGGYRRLCKGMKMGIDPKKRSIRRGRAAKYIAPY